MISRLTVGGSHGTTGVNELDKGNVDRPHLNVVILIHHFAQFFQTGVQFNHGMHARAEPLSRRTR